MQNSINKFRVFCNWISENLDLYIQYLLNQNTKFSNWDFNFLPLWSRCRFLLMQNLLYDRFGSFRRCPWWEKWDRLWMRRAGVQREDHVKGVIMSVEKNLKRHDGRSVCEAEEGAGEKGGMRHEIMMCTEERDDMEVREREMGKTWWCVVRRGEMRWRENGGRLWMCEVGMKLGKILVGPDEREETWDWAGVLLRCWDDLGVTMGVMEEREYDGDFGTREITWEKIQIWDVQIWDIRIGFNF